MSMEDRESGDSLRFSVIDKSPTDDLKVTCQASSVDIRDNWITHIRAILDMQGDFMKGIHEKYYIT